MRLKILSFFTVKIKNKSNDVTIVFTNYGNYTYIQGGGFMKDTTLNIRLNSIEKRLLKERAETLNMSVTDYVKYCCLYSEDSMGILKGIVVVKEQELEDKIKKFVEII